MVILGQADYEGTAPNAAYKDPYSSLPPYRDGPWVRQRGDRIRGSLATGKILIAGCGYGFLVNYLLGLGFDVYGADASDWAVSQASIIVPNRVMKADITNATQLASVKTFAGLKARTNFATIITEDVLTCLTDAEITAALTALRAITSSMAHIVTATEFPAQRDSRFNWKTLEQWKVIVGTEFVMGVETGRFL